MMQRLRRILGGIGTCFMVVLPALGQGTTVQYAPSDTLFPNPERGIYSHREVQAEGAALTLSDLTSIRNSKGQSLILRMYYLKKFRATDLSAAQLTLMQTDFARMRQAGIKCVLRFAYSSGETDPDAPLDIVLRHLDQLKPVIEQNRDVIAVIQAGFIGAWGEWYYSTNGLNTTANRRAVLQKFLETAPHPIFVQVRTPNYKMYIFNRTTPIDSIEAYSAMQYARTGHHNDCFLANADDYGTYEDTTADKAYLSSDTRFAPMGGETCNPNSFSTCGNAVRELTRMHWTFVNGDYQATVLAQWTNGGCMPEIKRRLGYRFEMIDGTYADSAKPGSGLPFALTLTNVGWAAPFNPRPAEVILRNPADSSEYYVRLPVDPRFWGAGDTARLSATIGVPLDMPAGEYEMFFRLPDPSESLRFRPEFADAARQHRRVGIRDGVQQAHAYGAHRSRIGGRTVRRHAVSPGPGSDHGRRRARPAPARPVRIARQLSQPVQRDDADRLQPSASVPRGCQHLQPARAAGRGGRCGRDAGRTEGSLR